MFLSDSNKYRICAAAWLQQQTLDCTWSNICHPIDDEQSDHIHHTTVLPHRNSFDTFYTGPILPAL